MSVRLRLGLTFVAVVVLLLVPVRYAEVRLNELREMAVERRTRHAAASLALGELRGGVAEVDRRQRAYLATLDPRLDRDVEAAIRDLEARIGELESAGYERVTVELTALVDSVDVLSQEIDRLVQAGAVEEATAVFQAVLELRAAIRGELHRVAAAIDETSQADIARAEEMSATAATTTLLATLAAALLALAVSIWTIAKLTKPLRTLSAAAARVEAGAFEAPEDLPYDRADEIGDLSRSFRAMTERLAELDRMKAEFMSVASHELKTPISVIRAYAELLELQVRDDLTEKQQVALETITEQTDVMVQLVGRLLNIGRLETGGYQLEPEDVALEELMKGLARSFDVLAEKEGVRLRTRIAGTAPDTIRVDVELLRNEVLGNLVSNALRYTPEGGEVRVSAWQEDGEVVLEVADTGPGIPEEQRPHIFQKYYEGDRTQAMGAGLGLAVAKEVTEAHGGRITLVEPDDGGARFRVYLPASPVP